MKEPIKILVVEDSLERIKVFRWMLSEFKTDFTDNAVMASSLICSTQYDLILLDHDLGGEGTGYLHWTEPNTGYQVAQCIPNSPNDQTPIIIHSWNPVGAKHIFDYLNNGTRYIKMIQFGLFGIDFVKFVLERKPLSRSRRIIATCRK